jgi:hypothetical protein
MCVCAAAVRGLQPATSSLSEYKEWLHECTWPNTTNAKGKHGSFKHFIKGCGLPKQQETVVWPVQVTPWKTMQCQPLHRHTITSKGTRVKQHIDACVYQKQTNSSHIALTQGMIAAKLLQADDHLLKLKWRWPHHVS